MNGFEKSIKESINIYLPEIKISHRFGIAFEKDDLNFFKQITPHNDSFLYNVLDGFLLKSNDNSSAIRSFELPASQIKSNFGFELDSSEEIIIGEGLAEKLGLQVGDEVTFLSQGMDQSNLAFFRKRVRKVVNFPIFEQSQRFVFSVISKEKKFTNHVGIAFSEPNQDEINSLVSELEAQADFNYKIDPYWSDFRFLLEAVEIEKRSISVVLQVIVVVAIFNVVAFLFYFKEINAKKIFILSAFGMSRNRRIKSWRKLILLVWSLSCGVSVFFVFLFDLALRYLPIFELPAKIYYLNRLSIKWNLSDFFMIFLISFAILFFITNFFIKRMESSSVLKNLREEFN